MLDYKDLAALPKTKAIYNIDRPDMLSYSPYVSYPSEERHYGEVVSLSPLCITSSCLFNLVLSLNVSFCSGMLCVYILCPLLILKFNRKPSLWRPTSDEFTNKHQKMLYLVVVNYRRLHFFCIGQLFMDDICIYIDIS